MSDVTTFFARRRAGLIAERDAEQANAQEPDVEAIDDTPDLEAMSDADILDLLDLPDPDTLQAGDNFAVFMAKAVPLHLRNRALRKLWRSDPVLACLDGLNDYDADYLTGSTSQGIIKTSYQIGKGLLAHVEKLEADAALDVTPAVEDIDVEAPADPEEMITFTDDASVAESKDDADEGDIPALPPRRMRFAFDGDRA